MITYPNLYLFIWNEDDAVYSLYECSTGRKRGYQLQPINVNSRLAKKLPTFKVVFFSVLYGNTSSSIVLNS